MAVDDSVLELVGGVDSHFSVMTANENVSLTTRMPHHSQHVAVKRSSTTIVQQNSLLDESPNTYALFSTSTVVKQVINNATLPASKRAKVESSSSRAVVRSSSNTSSSHQVNNKLPPQPATSTMVKCTVPLSVKRGHIISFFNDAKIQSVFAALCDKMENEYMVYVKFETIYGAELALDKSMEYLRFNEDQNQVALKLKINPVDKYEALWVNNIFLKLMTNESNGFKLKELASISEFSSSFDITKYCNSLDLLSNVFYYELFNQENVFSDVLSMDTFAYMLQAECDFRLMNLHTSLVEDICHSHYNEKSSDYSTSSSYCSVELKEALRKLSSKIIQRWQDRIFLEKSNVSSLIIANKEFGLLECVTRSIHLHQILYNVLWKTTANRQLHLS